VLELGEELLDGVEVRAVGRQKEHVGSRLADGASRCPAFVAAEIVEDDDIAFGEGRSQYLLDIEGEEFAVDGAIEAHGASTRSTRRAAMKVSVFQ